MSGDANVQEDPSPSEPTFRHLTAARDVPANMADRLIVALDVRSVEEARHLVEKLDGVVSFYKIGLWLLFAEGTDKLIDDLIAQGKDIFLDYKMFDISQTVAEGVARARDRKIKFLTVHGDKSIMEAAVREKGESKTLKIFAITVLTSLDDKDLEEMGYRVPVKELVNIRVRKAVACGCDGIIASADDNPNEIRGMLSAPGLLIATPGIRSEGEALDDQKRTATPAEAIRDGADYLVMGREIIRAPDPRARALAIIEEMEKGARESASAS